MTLLFPNNPVLLLEGVSCTVSPSFALQNISFQVNPGCVAGLIGPNGSGKTVLLNTISNLQYPAKGQIQFNGNSIKYKRLEQQSCMGIARTFQFTRLPHSLTPNQILHLAVFENKNALVWRQKKVKGATSSISFESALRYLKAFELFEKLHTPIKSLSYGQTKLLALAVCFSLKPRLLLLDEPFSGLHDNKIDIVCQLIKELSNDHRASFLIVEHNIHQLTAISDEILLLNKGRLILNGSPSDVVSSHMIKEVFYA